MIAPAETQPRQATSLGEIETAVRKFAAARQELGDLVGELNEKIEALKRQRLTEIKRAVARAAERQSEVHNLVEGAPELFVKPRTFVLHGIKIGFQKGKGGIEFSDPDRVCELIRKHLPDQEEALIRTKESPNKEALGLLPVADLKRIGCNVAEADDQVVIKATDSEVDKIVTALLEHATEEQG